MSDATSLPNEALYEHVFNTPFGHHYRCRTCSASLIGAGVDLRVHTAWHDQLRDDARFGGLVHAALLKKAGLA